MTAKELMDAQEFIANASSLKTQIWILGGLAAFLVTVSLAVLGFVANKISNKIEDLTESNNKINITMTSVLEQVKTLFASKDASDRNMESISNRVRDLEWWKAGMH
jgi:hypothetical protein